MRVWLKNKNFKSPKSNSSNLKPRGLSHHSEGWRVEDPLLTLQVHGTLPAAVLRQWALSTWEEEEEGHSSPTATSQHCTPGAQPGCGLSEGSMVWAEYWHSPSLGRKLYPAELFELPWPRAMLFLWIPTDITGSPGTSSALIPFLPVPVHKATGNNRHQGLWGCWARSWRFCHSGSVYVS